MSVTDSSYSAEFDSASTTPASDTHDVNDKPDPLLIFQQLVPSRLIFHIPGAYEVDDRTEDSDSIAG